MQTFTGHIPVLLKEVCSLLAPQAGKVYVDATFGNGSYSAAFLESTECKVIAFDRDPSVLERAEVFKKRYGTRFDFHHSCFSKISDYIQQGTIAGIVCDFGVSSMQIDKPERGFSFNLSGPLDMRMSQDGLSALEIINTYSEKDLAAIITTYGEEPKGYQIAKTIVSHRCREPILTTTELAIIIRRVAHKKSRIDSATLTFQALRIFVNNELIEIEQVLNHSRFVLWDGGKLLTIAFHVLEDRIVKQATVKPFTDRDCFYKFQKLNHKVILPSKEEVDINPRARSAKLRAFMKVRS